MGTVYATDWLIHMTWPSHELAGLSVGEDDDSVSSMRSGGVRSCSVDLGDLGSGHGGE